MEYKPKKREWVKNVSIIFLSILLVLTFFSNTLMNRSLPEVATQYVTNGNITAKVRGTGTVTAVGTHTVKADQTREIRAVMVKVGQEVKAGDVLFVLGQGEATELEAAQESLRQLQLSYQRTAAGISSPDYSLQERQISSARKALQSAQDYLIEIMKRSDNSKLPIEQLEAARAKVNEKTGELDEAKVELATARSAYSLFEETYGSDLEHLIERITSYEELQEALDKARKDLDELRLKWYEQKEMDPKLIPEKDLVTEEDLNIAEETVRILEDELIDWFYTDEISAMRARRDGILYEKEQKKAALDEAEKREAEAQEALDEAMKQFNAVYATVQEIMGQGVISDEQRAAEQAVKDAEDKLFTLEYELKQKKETDAQSQQLDYLTLTDIGAQIENAKKKVAELSGGEENQILAKVAGTVQTIECVPGDTKLKNDVLCTIEVPDMGYTMSFTVTNDQARRLKVGDSATVSNYYWGNQVTATLESIKTDPKNPQTNKLLTFEVRGDVNAGAELTISVGQKSANYDIIIPNSSIRSDTNGSFVLTVESKSSPLGNRYIARRVDVDVLAEDDVNSAVTANLSYGDYVITTSNAPVKNGDMVRLADNP